MNNNNDPNPLIVLIMITFVGLLFTVRYYSDLQRKNEEYAKPIQIQTEQKERRITKVLKWFWEKE